MNTISTDGWSNEECPSVTVMEMYKIELVPCPEYDLPSFDLSRDGIRDAARRHDALSRRRYVKPFKWFKFNRARKATAK